MWTSDPAVLVRATSKDSTARILTASFNLEDDRVITVSSDGTVRRWSMISHELLQAALRNATNLCLGEAFRPAIVG